jgi:hypothetical protein
MTEAPRDPVERNLPLRSPLELAGGLFLIAIAAAGFIGAYPLPFGQLSGIGSGLVPKVVATLVAAFGLLLVLQGLLVSGTGLERWGVRGPVMVLGAVLVFAFTVRPLGLVVAGPAAFVIAALADRNTRPVEVVVSALLATLACGFLFKELLGLPIPFDPSSLLSPLHAPYEAVKAGIKGLLSALPH